ncbi:DrmB family protein [Pseudomonadota bacterium]
MAHRPVRRAQLISPFGVGAMIDFPNDEALMTAGLEAWPHANEECPADWKITEERLQERLRVDHFRLPPDYRTEDVDARYVGQKIPFVRFPRWHYCPVSNCGKMVRRHLFGSGTPACDSSVHSKISPSRKPRPIPVRFVAICPKGHIEDFPFMQWVHGGKPPADAGTHILSYKAGRSAALSGISIICTCGKRRSMGGAFNYDSQSGGALSGLGYLCRGNQPWLGVTDTNGRNCGDHLRVVQRGAANVYFPRTFSSIYLPLWGEDTNKRIVQTLEEPKIWTLLTSGLEEGIRVSPEKCEWVASMRGVDAGELREVAQRRLDGHATQTDITEEEFRRGEYEALRNARGDQATDLFVETVEVGHYESWVSTFFEKICLVRKLRETRVHQSFSRLLPLEATEGQTTDAAQPLAANAYVNWLPAMIVRGEGIYIELNEKRLDTWLANSPAPKRALDLSRQYNQTRLHRGLNAAEFDAKFLLMHTLAHVLIRQLSYDCGYGSAALRERLYCNRSEDSAPMNGILIYTAAGDSEGTMGGLVRQGLPDNLESTLREAIKSTDWCSSDPVCIESTGQGTDSANLAACHGCALLPETSCEEGNRLLDRAMIRGIPRDLAIGFFHGLS